MCGEEDWGNVALSGQWGGFLRVLYQKKGAGCVFYALQGVWASKLCIIYQNMREDIVNYYSMNRQATRPRLMIV